MSRHQRKLSIAATSRPLRGGGRPCILKLLRRSGAFFSIRSRSALIDNEFSRRLSSFLKYRQAIAENFRGIGAGENLALLCQSLIESGYGLEYPMRFHWNLWDQFAGNRGAIMYFPRQRLAFFVAELAPSLLEGLHNCGSVAVANPPHRVAGGRAAYRCISRNR